MHMPENAYFKQIMTNKYKRKEITHIINLQWVYSKLKI